LNIFHNAAASDPATENGNLISANATAILTVTPGAGIAGPVSPTALPTPLASSPPLLWERPGFRHIEQGDTLWSARHADRGQRYYGQQSGNGKLDSRIRQRRPDHRLDRDVIRRTIR